MTKENQGGHISRNNQGRHISTNNQFRNYRSYKNKNSHYSSKSTLKVCGSVCQTSGSERQTSGSVDCDYIVIPKNLTSQSVCIEKNIPNYLIEKEFIVLSPKQIKNGKYFTISPLSNEVNENIFYTKIYRRISLKIDKKTEIKMHPDGYSINDIARLIHNKYYSLNSTKQNITFTLSLTNNSPKKTFIGYFSNFFTRKEKRDNKEDNKEKYVPNLLYKKIKYMREISPIYVNVRNK